MEGGRQEKRRWRTSITAVAVLSLGLVAALLTPALAQAVKPGALDRSFSHNGKVRTDFAGPHDGANAVALDPHGRVVAAGHTCNADYRECDFAVARYRPGGRLDGSFSGNGLKATDFHGGDDSIGSVAVDSQGRIVAAGATGDRRTGDFALARYGPDGGLDRSFGAGGRVTTDFGHSDSVSSLAIDSDGRILAVGNSCRAEYHCDYALARYEPDGSLDGSFGTGGRVTMSFQGNGNGNVATAVAIDSLGRIVVAGNRWDKSTYTYDFALDRYQADGTIDPSFGDGGEVTTSFGVAYTGGAAEVMIDSEGRILVAGTREDDEGLQTGDFALARYVSDGTVDSSFGTDGKVITDFSPYAYASSAALDSRGRIVVVGYVYNRAHGERFALARYKPTGELDRSFGGDGQVATEFRGNGIACAVAIDSEDRAVVAGNTPGGHEDFALARYVGYRYRP